MGAHVLCCLFICLIYQKDFNDTWVKRIPYPYPDVIYILSIYIYIYIYIAEWIPDR